MSARPQDVVVSAPEGERVDEINAHSTAALEGMQEGVPLRTPRLVVMDGVPTMSLPLNPSRRVFLWGRNPYVEPRSLPGEWARVRGVDWVNTPDVPDWWPRWVVESFEDDDLTGESVPLPFFEAVAVADDVAEVVKIEALLNPWKTMCVAPLAGRAPNGWSRHDWHDGILVLYGEEGRIKASIAGIKEPESGGVYQVAGMDVEGRGKYQGATPEECFATWTPESLRLAKEALDRGLKEFGIEKGQLDYSLAREWGVPV